VGTQRDAARSVDALERAPSPDGSRRDASLTGENDGRVQKLYRERRSRRVPSHALQHTRELVFHRNDGKCVQHVICTSRLFPFIWRRGFV
jgi:hypothetical protein